MSNRHNPARWFCANCAPTKRGYHSEACPKCCGFRKKAQDAA